MTTIARNRTLARGQGFMRCVVGLARDLPMHTWFGGADRVFVTPASGGIGVNLDQVKIRLPS